LPGIDDINNACFVAGSNDLNTSSVLLGPLGFFFRSVGAGLGFLLSVVTILILILFLDFIDDVTFALDLFFLLLLFLLSSGISNKYILIL